MPVISYSTVSELEQPLDRSSLELILLCLSEEGLGSTSLALKIFRILRRESLSSSSPATATRTWRARQFVRGQKDTFRRRWALKSRSKRCASFYLAEHTCRWTISSLLSSRSRSLRAPSSVTTRELAVVRAIQQGKSNKIIAYELNMCESTVKVHVRNLMKKLNAKNRTDVAIQAQIRLVSPLGSDANLTEIPRLRRRPSLWSLMREEDRGRHMR